MFHMNLPFPNHDFKSVPLPTLPFSQVVVLGAGYDMRGARLGLGDAGVKVFEAR